MPRAYCHHLVGDAGKSNAFLAAVVWEVLYFGVFQAGSYLTDHLCANGTHGARSAGVFLPDPSGAGDNNNAPQNHLRVLTDYDLNFLRPLFTRVAFGDGLKLLDEIPVAHHSKHGFFPSLTSLFAAPDNATDGGADGERADDDAEHSSPRFAVSLAELLSGHRDDPEQTARHAYKHKLAEVDRLLDVEKSLRIELPHERASLIRRWLTQQSKRKLLPPDLMGAALYYACHRFCLARNVKDDAPDGKTGFDTRPSTNGLGSDRGRVEDEIRLLHLAAAYWAQTGAGSGYAISGQRLQARVYWLMLLCDIESVSLAALREPARPVEDDDSQLQLVSGGVGPDEDSEIRLSAVRKRFEATYVSPASASTDAKEGQLSPALGFNSGFEILPPPDVENGAAPWASASFAVSGATLLGQLTTLAAVASTATTAAEQKATTEQKASTATETVSDNSGNQLEDLAGSFDRLLLADAVRKLLALGRVREAAFICAQLARWLVDAQRTRCPGRGRRRQRAIACREGESCRRARLRCAAGDGAGAAEDG